MLRVISLFAFVKVCFEYQTVCQTGKFCWWSIDIATNISSSEYCTHTKTWISITQKNNLFGGSSLTVVVSVCVPSCNPERRHRAGRSTAQYLLSQHQNLFSFSLLCISVSLQCLCPCAVYFYLLVAWNNCRRASVTWADIDHAFPLKSTG